MTNKNKGIVMEASSKGYVTVMTSQGEFLNIPWKKSTLPTVGIEVEFDQPIVRQGFFWTHSFSALAASIAIIFLFMSIWNFIFLPQSQMVVAYVNVDINPSIEFGINKKGNVVEVLGLNKDGEELLKDLELTGLPIEEAIEKTTLTAIEEKYLAPEKENAVLITVSSDVALPGKVKDLENEVKNVLRKNNITAEANTLSVPKELHEQAKEENISTGKYVLYMEAVEQGLDISLDDLREQSMKKAVEQAGGVPGQLISNAKKDEKRLEEISQKIKQRKLEIKEKIEIRKNEKQTEEKQVEKKRQESKRVENSPKKESQQPDNLKAADLLETEAADADIGAEEQGSQQDANELPKQEQKQPDDDIDDNMQQGNSSDSKNPQNHGNTEKKAGNNEGIINKIKKEIQKRFERD